MKTTTAIVILSLLISVTGVALAEEELSPVQQDLESAESIEITTNDVRIELFETEDGEERLEGFLHPKRTLTVKERANSLTVEISKENGIYSEEEVLQIFIAGGTSISIRSGSGDIDISDLGFSDLAIETGSGDISMDNSDGIMNFSVGSGDITVFRSSGEKVFSAGSGDIGVRKSDGDISASSSSGDITLSNIAGELSLSTNSGDIYGNKLEATTDSTFQSSSGDIEINFMNAEEDLKFDITSRSGTMSFGKTEASGTLLLGSGSILITGRTSSGDQEYSFSKKKTDREDPDNAPEDEDEE